MRKSLLFQGVRTSFDVNCDDELISSRVWYDAGRGYRRGEYLYRVRYVVGCHEFDTTKIVTFGARVTEIWIDVHGRPVYSENLCLESFINSYK